MSSVGRNLILERAILRLGQPRDDNKILSCELPPVPPLWPCPCCSSAKSWDLVGFETLTSTVTDGTRVRQARCVRQMAVVGALLFRDTASSDVRGHLDGTQTVFSLAG
jgi:hypothetical protein